MSIRSMYSLRDLFHRTLHRYVSLVLKSIITYLCNVLWNFWRLKLIYCIFSWIFSAASVDFCINVVPMCCKSNKFENICILINDFSLNYKNSYTLTFFHTYGHHTNKCVQICAFTIVIYTKNALIIK